MRKMEVTRKRAIFTHDGEITLVYSVTIDERTADGLAGPLEDYGVCVDIPERGESACLRGITVSAGAIMELTSLLSDNFVTPCTLSDVVYDWTCDR